jgi:hypothetical protein
MRPDGVLTLCFDSGLFDAIECTSLFLRRPDWEIRVNDRSIYIRRRSARNLTGSSNNAATAESQLVTDAGEVRRYRRANQQGSGCGCAVVERIVGVALCVEGIERIPVISRERKALANAPWKVRV